MVTLNQDYILQKSYHDLGLLAPNRYEFNLSNKVLKIDFGQGAGKISKVKVGGQKNLPVQSLAWAHQSRIQSSQE